MVLSEQLNDLRVEASDLVSAQGKTIPKKKIDILYGEYVPVPWHTAESPPEDLEGQAPGFYPDPLLPSLWRETLYRCFPDTIGIWIRIPIDHSVSAGKYQGQIKVDCRAGKGFIDVELEVLPFSLPKRSHLLMTNWPNLLLMHNALGTSEYVASILKFHKIEPLSDEFWKVIELYARNLAEHRQNVILTPLFPMSSMLSLLDNRIQGQLIDILEDKLGSYSFDFYNLDKWIEIFFKYGFELIEGGHIVDGHTARPSLIPADILLRKTGKKEAEMKSFSSISSKEYQNFLKQFLSSLREHLARRNWLNRFCLHISDEPDEDQFEVYRSLAIFVKSIAPEFKLMDAMGRAEFAQYVDYPVPVESVYEEFVKASKVAKEQIWFYYCALPQGAWPNHPDLPPLIVPLVKLESTE